MTWVDLGTGSLGIDWSKDLGSMKAVDPYVAWFDVTGFAGAAGKATVLLLELRKPLDASGKDHLSRHLGLTSGDFYLGRRFVTARCKERAYLAVFLKAMADGTDPWVKRYELSSMARNSNAGQPRTRHAVAKSMATSASVPALPKPALSDRLVGFIDYGCAFAHRQFQDVKGATRVTWLWNQQDESDLSPYRPRKPVLSWTTESRFGYGQEVWHGAIQSYIEQFPLGAGIDEEECYRNADYEAIRYAVTHGTHVMDVATGYPYRLQHVPTSNLKQRHVADIAFVQLPRFADKVQISGLLRANVLDALHYVASKLTKTGKGVINLSYGFYCGPHDGSSILEQAMDDLVLSYRAEGKTLNLVVPTGNALDQDIHAQFLLRSGQTESLLLQTLPDDPSESYIELWLPVGAEVRLKVTPPLASPLPSAWIVAGQAKRLVEDGRTTAAIVFPNQVCQSDRGRMVLLALAPSLRPLVPSARRNPERGEARYGTWRIDIENLGAGPALVDAWCERDDPVFGTEGGPRQSRFANLLEPTGTLNSIAHGREPLVVGGYELHADDIAITPGSISRYSGTGPGRGLPDRDRCPPDPDGTRHMAPDVMAPSEMGTGEPGIDAAAVLSDDTARLAGTSMAAAFATRIIIENDFEIPALPQGPQRLRIGLPEPPLDEPVHPDDDLPIPRWPS